ncbi:MSMEG_0565 family glycosyltransferase [Actinomycetospora sp. TBRC 11914]|uniref:MSMEG_0565 family glycosyltransferase n=1 Tax=Actinomycetospora sp. TBRC 11914 TaxID=2729387 RepID=UPI00145F5994|nr:MSMEG_0565 family glycosyltransferase [Actinomycetospora sp. TBRC 11914]NMO88745.1 MSMEG_0565 family glycosyltransferase [Actinomycetospora sp. TBRC 11914]
MRIRLSTYSTKPRGGVVHTLALGEALARAGHDVEVWALARGGDTAFFRDVSVPIRLVGVPEIEGESVGDRILRSIALLADALADAGPVDVRHAQDCLTANAEGRAHGYAGLVRTVHHLDEFTTPSLVTCHERALVEPAALLCVSDAVAAEVKAGWGRTAPVVGNGVDAARFAAAASSGAGAPWRERFGRYVLAVGGIEPRKGTRDLVAAMAALARRGVDAPLVVAGGDTLFDYRPYREEVFALAASLGVEPVVLGPVPQADLPGIVAGASVFAFPSTKEGFGLAAMEALAAGVPVVARDLPVLREVFAGAVRFAADGADFAEAYAAELADVLTGGDPARPAQAAVGRALAASHSWDAVARAHLAAYGALRAPSGTRRGP